MLHRRKDTILAHRAESKAPERAAPNVACSERLSMVSEIPGRYRRIHPRIESAAEILQRSENFVWKRREVYCRLERVASAVDTISG